MKVLELFAGSRSIGKICDQMGVEVLSIDRECFPGIDLCVDIMDMTKEGLSYVPDVIWASPPCTFFSVASIGKHWYKDNTPKTKEAVYGKRILEKTLEIFSWFPNAIYFMENPRGKMRKMEVVQSLPRHTVWYCQYGDDRAKPTDIWTNSTTWVPRPQCKNSNTNCHHQPAPRGSATGTQGRKGSFNRSMIPQELCTEIMLAAYGQWYNT